MNIQEGEHLKKDFIEVRCLLLHAIENWIIELPFLAQPHARNTNFRGKIMFWFFNFNFVIQSPFLVNRIWFSFMGKYVKLEVKTMTAAY